MNFYYLVYWQDKVLSFVIENCLFINGEYIVVVENEIFEIVDLVIQVLLVKIVCGKSVDIDCVVSVVCGVFECGDWLFFFLVKCKVVLNKFVDLMEVYVEELVLLEIFDIGKLICYSLCDDIFGVVCVICWYVEVIDKVYGEVVIISSYELVMIVCELVGVIVVIVLWNFLLLLICWKFGLVLVVGNSVILKLFEKLLFSVICFVGLVKEVGLLDGVLNVVMGFGYEVGQVLLCYNDIDVIVFIGLICIGKQLLKDVGDSNMKCVWLEVGGKSVNFVFVDCLDL